MQQVDCGTIRDDYLYFAMGSTMGILFCSKSQAFFKIQRV